MRLLEQECTQPAQHLHSAHNQLTPAPARFAESARSQLSLFAARTPELSLFWEKQRMILRV